MHNIVLSPIGIENLVSLIADEVVKKLSSQPEPSEEKLFGVDGAMLITDLSKQTIYNKVAKREIPHQRKNGRLYFSSTELTEWIKSGKRKTNEEIKADAQSYLKKKGVNNV
ncbi:helix-turn-helix domain-containing protein [Sphingobacterium rhinopitheci]|uniref:helix-turn-helix domain-containing protein n=1 Tax=Sphingobacterium rhinopitheci TaxID=2781960 RepID=UPI001F52896F|nr:helix-turn-helix domain-containing protein [Sphingobacterium rhinopitheci]MCI0922280.1 helix-turn-helix domain-containing protein [Sphingobacterium rhinopitheci]